MVRTYDEVLCFNTGGTIMRLKELVIYTELLDDNIINKYISFIDANNDTEIREYYFDLIRELISVEMTFETYFYTKMIEVENPILKRLSHNDYVISEIDTACLRNDLYILNEIINYDIKTKINTVDDGERMLSLLISSNTTDNIINAYKDYFKDKAMSKDSNDIDDFLCLLKDYGTGMFANNSAFYINQMEEIRPIKDFSTLSWDQIYDYEYQKEALLSNTKALVNGQPYHHTILQGDSGTGKSSCVKAVADLFKDDKLRLVQLYKRQLHCLPNIIESLSGSSFKFIIFIDDLSFEVHEDDYKLLNSYIEGGVINENNNIAFYVTSNRQNLIKEAHSDRESDVRVNDLLEESISLSARFGLHLTFMKPNQDEFLEMVIKMLDKEEISYNKDKIEAEAKRWVLRHSGRSGRIAMQFVKQLKMSATENL